MLRTLAKLPLILARDLLRSVIGGGQEPPPPPRAADPWEARNAGRTPAASPAPDRSDSDHGQSHEHSHGHSHGHSHDHGHRQEPAASPPVSVHAEETPNPNAMKFTVDRSLVESGSISFNAAAEAEDHALGKALFAVDGVRSIFAVNDFVTVTKDDTAGWDAVGPAVADAIKQCLS